MRGPGYGRAGAASGETGAMDAPREGRLEEYARELKGRRW